MVHCVELHFILPEIDFVHALMNAGQIAVFNLGTPLPLWYGLVALKL